MKFAARVRKQETMWGGHCSAQRSEKVTRCMSPSAAREKIQETGWVLVEDTHILKILTPEIRDGIHKRKLEN